MQRFKDFTKKSGKVASAILSAAMVTSMVAGTNVVYAANTEATTETTDVTAAGKVSEETQRKVDAIVTVLKTVPVNAATSEDEVINSTSLTFGNKVATEANKLTKKTDTAITGSAITVTNGAFKIKEKPTKDKAGNAELTFTFTNGNDVVTETVSYVLESGNDRAATLKAAIEKKIDEKAFATTNATLYINDVLGEVAAKTDDTFGMTLYADLATTATDAAELSVNPPEKEKSGSVKGSFDVNYFPSKYVNGTTEAKDRLGKLTVNLNKTLPSYKEAAATGKKDFEAYLDTVKCINSNTDEDMIAKVADKFAKDSTVTTSASVYEVKTSVSQTKAGKADAGATITSVFDSAKTTTEGALKTVTILSDEQQADLILSDFVKYAKASSNESHAAFAADFVKAFNEDNTKINTGKDLKYENERILNYDEAVSGVYGTKASDSVILEFDAKDGKPVAKITVKFGNADEKTETVELAGEQEAPKGQFIEKDGKKFYYDENGQLLQNTFLQGTDSPDGYTYYIQNDGSVMQDRLTYYPNSADVIYFDKDGHEVFDAFVNVKKDIQGNAVDYIGYFNTSGKAYTNVTTYGNGEGAYAKDALFYINDYGVLENKGWFKNAAGEIGYAAPNGTLTTSQWSLDQFGRKVYFQANGFLAKGLMTDGVKYYQLDETDGHLVGEF